jgi:LAO/AO transport system kinase
MRNYNPNLAERILNGDMKAAARLISYIDDNVPEARNDLKKIFHKTGKAYLIGLTGAPGVGKSTILDYLIRSFREAGKKLGVIAVDPTSPFSGGAILGDRIRIQDRATEGDVFFRSLATRGAMGGLSMSVTMVVRVMEAMGKEMIIIETVGVGQDEVDIGNLAHTTVMIMIPGLGDEIQTIKAGTMEIGDIFVINKCEKEGAEILESQILDMLRFSEGREDCWSPLIYKTEAIKGYGMPSLVEGINRHSDYLRETKQFEKKSFKRTEWEFMAIMREYVTQQILTKVQSKKRWEEMIHSLMAGDRDPYSLTEEIYRGEN